MRSKRTSPSSSSSARCTTSIVSRAHATLRHRASPGSSYMGGLEGPPKPPTRSAAPRPSRGAPRFRQQAAAGTPSAAPRPSRGAPRFRQQAAARARQRLGEAVALLHVTASRRGTRSAARQRLGEVAALPTWSQPCAADRRRCHCAALRRRAARQRVRSAWDRARRGRRWAGSSRRRGRGDRRARLQRAGGRRIRA
jgi:hypothetical protein